MDREARHRRARALSHRPGARRHPPDRARRRHLLRALPRPPLLRASGGDGAQDYLDTQPDPAVTTSCSTTSTGSRRGTAAWSPRASARFPSYPQRFIEPLADQPPCDRDLADVEVEPLRSHPAADALHRGRPPHPAVHPRVVPPAGPEGRLQGRMNAARADESAATSSRTPAVPRGRRRSSWARARTRRAPIAIADVRRAAPSVVEEQQVAGGDVAGLTRRPASNWARTSRGSATPCCAKTYWVNPLQSKPPRIGAAVPVGHAAKPERGRHDWTRPRAGGAARPARLRRTAPPRRRERPGHGAGRGAGGAQGARRRRRQAPAARRSARAGARDRHSCVDVYRGR